MEELIEELRRSGISLSVEDDKLRVLVDENQEIPAHYLKELKDRKAEVITFLQQENIYDITDEYPCSPNQRSLYFNYKKDISSSSYNMVYLYELEQDVDITLFKSSVDKVVKRHDALRTCFVEKNNQLIQKIIPSQDVKVDISVFSYDQYDEDNVTNILKVEAQRAFNLEVGKLLRITLIQAKDRSLLLLSLHHIVGDIVSLQIIAKEIYEYYMENGVNLVPIKQHYKDYCVWLENKLNENQKVEKHWLEKFSGLETTTRLQNDLNFSTKHAIARVVNYPFPDSCLAVFKKICQENNASFYVGFSSLVSLLFNKITGSKDITFGSPVTARHFLNHQDQVGYYVNTVPVRIKVDEELSFIDFLQGNKINLNEGISLSYYPMSYLVNKLKNGKDLFNILVVYQNQDAFVESESIKRIYSKLELSVKYDLIIEFSDIAGGNINIKMEYNESLYSESYIKTVYNALCSIINNVCEDPETKLNKIALANDYSLNTAHTKKAFPSHETIVSLFNKCVEGHGDKIAIIHKDKNYSFNEIDKRSNQLSHFLQSKGVDKREIIPISTDKSIETIIGILAILKLGAAYSPIDKLYPKQRQVQLREITGSKIYLDEFLMNEFTDMVTTFPDTPIDTIITPEDLLYVIFTSGSTGTPKGCMLNNKGIVNRLHWMWNYYGFTVEDTILQKTSFSFDVSVWELFLPLCWGCKMVLVEDGMAQKPDQIMNIINKHWVNHIHFVPSMLEAFVNYLKENNISLNVGNPLKNIYTSGEVLTKQIVEKWFNCTNIPVKNLYGPTEASVDVTYYDVYPDSEIIYIGKPIDNINIHILSEDTILPIGLYGEICIAGIGLAMGYLGDTEKTNEKFIFHDKLNERLYRTGDIGRYTADGFIEFLGRKDDQIKIRGFRVELNEIDYVIANLTYIRAAKTLYEKNKLTCYFIADEGKDGDIEMMIRGDIKQQLPEYMIPHFFVEVEAMPTTVNGKLDRNKLIQQQMVRKSVTLQYPVGNKDLILSIWAEVLEGRVEDIDPSKNFFENGGDSLSLLNLISKLKNIGIHITYDDFIAAPYLANIISNVPASAVTKVELDEHPFILSPIQEWYFTKNPDNASFLMYSIYLLTEDFSVKMIRMALNAICQKHSSFRLRYIQNLFWHQYYDIKSPIDQLYAFNDLRIEHSIEDCIKEAERNIDTKTGPNLYVSLFKSEEGMAIFFACPHLIMDAVSWNIFTNDFVYYYNNPNLTPAYTNTYKDWILNHLSHINGNINKEEIDFWVEQVSDKNTYRSELAPHRRMESLSIQNNNKNSKSTENIVLAALTYSLGRILQLPAVHFEKEGHGREMVNKFDSADIIGWFTSKYPVKYIPDNESLDQTYSNVVSANKNMPYNGVWFDKYKRMSPRPIRNLLNAELAFSFNYLGVLNQSSTYSSPLAKPLISLNTYINGDKLEEISKNFYQLEINCGVIEGEVFLSLNASEKLGLKDYEWIAFLRDLNKSIRTLMEHSKNDSENISNDDGTLSGFQKELVAHSLIHADESENYIIQWEFKIQNVDKSKLKESCRALLHKFEILRTAYFFNVQKGLFCSKVLSVDDAFVFNEYKQIGVSQLKNISIGVNRPLIKFSLINDEIFVITAHHALVDGHSMFIVLRELLNLYENIQSNIAYVPYREYIQHIRSKDRRIAIDYWKSLLSAYLSNKSVTYVYNNTSFNECSVTFKISREIQNRIKAHRLTVSTVFNFLFGNTYSVLINEPNLIWGNIVNYRTTEIKNMDTIVGPCINTIPVCFDFSKSTDTFFADIAKLQKQVITSQHYSFVSLQEIIEVMGKKELFNLLFTYQNYKKAELDTARLQIEMLNENIISSHFPLTVLVNQSSEEEFMVRVKYNTILYTDEFIQNFLKLYTSSLQHLKIPEKKTSLALIKGEDSRTLSFKSLIEGFETWSKNTPDNIAIVGTNQKITYKDLNEQGNYICAQLMMRGATDCVVVCLSNIEKYAPAIIGILKAGLHFINIDESFSSTTKKKILQQLTPSVLITDDNGGDLLTFFASDNIINLQYNIEHKSDEPIIVPNNRQVVTINYTSGSTGEPKLVKIDHKSHLNRLNWLIQNFPATEGDQYVLKSSFSFAPALRELFEPLCQGATLHIISGNIQKNVDEFCMFMQNRKISRIFLTPSYIKLLITNNKLAALKDVKFLEISGEPYSYELVHSLNNLLPETILLNRYGCTEAASVVYHQFPKKNAVFGSQIPSGKPIFNTEIMICDQHFNTVSVGVTGTILIKSTCLFIGYVKSEQNKKKFIELNGSTWLNTEDLGYIDGEGCLYYVSRDSRMVKVRGYRVELDELEVIAKKHGDIKDAYADIETNEYGSFIVFYYSSFSNNLIEKTILNEYFTSELPEYAVPYKYVYVSVFPLTLNGKIDTQSLKKYTISQVNHRDSFPIQESMETNIINILKDLLKINEDIDPIANFRTLGLDSILSMYFIHKVHNVLGIKVDPILLYKNNSVRLFVNALHNNSNQVNYSVINQESKNIVFMITPASDGAIDFDYIRNILTHDYSLIIFDPVNLHSGETASNLKALAEKYTNILNSYLDMIEGVKSVSIAGWSLGATIAYQVATDLKKRSIAFNHLILIDPGFYDPKYDDQVTRISLTNSLEKLDPDRIFTDRYIDTMLKANQLIKNYKPEKIDHKIVLVKPKDISPFERNYHHKLNQLDIMGNTAIELMLISGNHMTIIQNIEEILELFNQILHD